MALRRDMPTRDPKRAETDSRDTTTYQASRGGYYPPKETPTPGAKK